MEERANRARSESYHDRLATTQTLSRKKTCAGGCRAVIRVYDAAGTVIETHEHMGEFKEW